MSSQQNQQIVIAIKKIIRLFEPSWFGIIIYFLIILVPLLTGYILNKLPEINSLSINDFKGSIFYGTVNTLDKIFNSTQINSLLDYAFWAFIATIIYTTAHYIVGNADEISRDLRVRKYVWPRGADRNGPIEVYIAQFIIRIIIGILVMLYIFKLLPTLFKLFTSTNFSSFINVMFHIGLSLLLIHLFVVLLRLFRLKYRLVDL